MKQSLKRTWKQQAIHHQDVRDTWHTDAWLQSQGFSADNFTDLDILLLQAQQIAHNCLKQHGRLLDHKEVKILNHFLQCLQKKPLRQAMRPTQAYQVMNIGTSVNRRVFKQLKQQTRQTQAT
jgi:hypothetical protein